MSGSSIGSIIGGVIGAILAPFTGGTSLMAAVSIGMALGGIVGSLLDQPKGVHSTGPRLHDLNQQTATYGTFLPRIYGTIAVMGNVFWIENNQLKEVATTEEFGGKGGMGGPSASQTTYKYYGTFAISLCEGLDPAVFGAGSEIKLLRIWVSGKLMYNADSDDFDTILESDDRKTKFAFYSGTDTQTPDPRMQADLGVANCPAYRGVCYIVIYDFDVENYGNSIAGAQFKVELATENKESSLLLQKKFSAEADIYMINANYIDPDGNLYIWEKLEPLHHVGVTRLAYFNIETGKKTYSKYSATLQDVMLSDGWVDVPCFCLANGTHTYVYNDKFEVIKDIPVSGDTDGGGQGVYFYRRNNKFLFETHHGVTSTVIYDDTGTILHKSTAASPDGFVKSIGMGNSKIYAMSDNLNFVVYDYNFNKLWSFDASSMGINLDQGQGSSDFIIREESDGVVVCCITNRFWRISRTNVDYLGTVNIKTGYESHGGDGYWRGWWVRYAAQHGEISRTLVRKITYPPIPLSKVVSAEVLKTGLLKAADFNATDLTQDVRGYRVSSLGSVRAGIEPLRGFWPFDGIQDGYKITFISRTTGSTGFDTKITEADLDARQGGSTPGIRITTSREMETQLPRKVSITYMDVNREYDNGNQYYERTNTDSVNVTELELPIVLNAYEAYGKAQTLEYLYWLERYDVEFTLPPTYNNLQPTDIVSFVSDADVYKFRITNINYTPDGRLECKAKFNHEGIYAPTQHGNAGVPAKSTLSRYGATVYELLDIPLLQDVYNTAGFPVAMAGNLSGWPGGILYRSDDGGATYSAKQGFTKPGATLGSATNVIGAQNAALLDKTSRLNVRLTYGSLSSVSELAMFNGSNYFAYGDHGRWEIIAAQNAVLQADGSYTLYDLLRGRFGTEQYMDDHAIDDLVVLLNSSTVKFLSASSSMIGQSRKYKGITNGALLSSVSAKDFTYEGVNLECLSPVYPKASRSPVDSSITIEWIRRGRMSPNWMDKIDVPVGETTEAYEIDVYADNTFTAIKRTLTSSSQLVVYSAAAQAADFGALSSGDAVYNSVSVLLYCTGANNSTAFPDSSKTPKTVTANGNAKVITTQTDPFGASTGVAAFDGIGDFLSSPFNSALDLIGSDFTIEAFIRPTHASNASGRRIIATGGGNFAWNSTNGIHIFTGINPDGTYVFGFWNGSAGSGVGTVATVANNTWTHVATSVSGSTIYMSVNGNVISFSGNNLVRPSANPSLNIGTINGEAGAAATAFTGQMSNIRITKGVARYKENFIVPASAFPNTQAFNQLNVIIYQMSSIAGRGYPLKATLNLLNSGIANDAKYSNRILGLHFNGANASSTFTDNSPTPKTITANGNAQISTAQSKFGGASGLFDGTGDYLTSAANAAFNILSGDYTVSMWVNPSAVPNFPHLIMFYVDNNNRFVIQYNPGSTRFDIFTAVGGTGTTYSSASASLPLNTWTHVAMVKSGTTSTLYINGASVYSGTISYPSGSFSLVIGSARPVTTIDDFNGYIDDLYIYNTALWTANFTPPSAPYADS